MDSFNSKLGLPRWRDTAIVAGSVAWINLENPPDDWAERMQKLESEGIGCRCNEGFGRIAFSHPVYDQRQKLNDSAIALDQKMKLGLNQNRDRFMEEWDDKLGVLLPQERHLEAPFHALARWMHIHNETPPQEMINQLALMNDPEKAFFGQPDKNLIMAIGEAEYGERNKKNPLIEKGKGDIGVILKALEYLKNKDPIQWRCGIDHLAERIAVMARDKQKGGI